MALDYCILFSDRYGLTKQVETKINGKIKKVKHDKSNLNCIFISYAHDR